MMAGAASSSSGKMLEVDGSLMEGGGQILRMSVALSSLLDRPVRIFNIRGKRSKPGLKSQHLTGINLVRELTGGDLQGGALNSSEIVFSPGRIPREGGSFSADIGTAGATTLLAQVSLPCLVFVGGGGPFRLDLRGGTNADMAPMVEYYEEVFLPSLRRFGLPSESVLLEVMKKGYFPRGGGRVRLSVGGDATTTHSLPLKNLEMTERGKITKLLVKASVAGTLPIRLAEEMAQAARDSLAKKFADVDIQVECFKEKSATGNGSSVFVLAETSTGYVLGDSAVGSPKVKPRKSGEDAAAGLLTSLESGACADRWLQDQLIIFMALASGRSRMRTGPLTLHTETAIDIAEKFTGVKFEVKKDSGDSFLIECEGMGLDGARAK